MSWNITHILYDAYEIVRHNYTSKWLEVNAKLDCPRQRLFSLRAAYFYHTFATIHEILSCRRCHFTRRWIGRHVVILLRIIIFYGSVSIFSNLGLSRSSTVPLSTNSLYIRP
jgi:hypothetical protein